MKGCTKECICLKYQKSCMKACRQCSDIIKMHVRKCNEYADFGKQMTVEDIIKDFKHKY